MKDETKNQDDKTTHDTTGTAAPRCPKCGSYHYWASCCGKCGFVAGLETDTTGAGIRQKFDLLRMERAYIEAANDLVAYREAHGFEPGARVMVYPMEGVPKEGAICDYGRAWHGIDAHQVPVDMGEYFQPWAMSSLELIDPEPTAKTE